MSWPPIETITGFAETARLIPVIDVEFIPTTVPDAEFAALVSLAYLGDSTSDGKLIFKEAFQKADRFFVSKGSRILSILDPDEIGGMDIGHRKLRKGPIFQMRRWLKSVGGVLSETAVAALGRVCDCNRRVRAILVADEKSDLGVVVISWTFRSSN